MFQELSLACALFVGLDAGRLELFQFNWPRDLPSPATRTIHTPRDRLPRTRTKLTMVELQYTPLEAIEKVRVLGYPS